MDTLKAVGAAVGAAVAEVVAEAVLPVVDSFGAALVGSSSSVMVRQVPLQQMLSPSLASDKIRGHEDMVSEVPPPPVDVESRDARVEIAGSWRQ